MESSKRKDLFMASGKRKWLFLTIILSAFVVLGCASAFNSRGLNLTAEANYTQLVKEFESPGENYARMPFSQLIYLCTAYAELKNYRKRQVMSC
jgi:hypothetical protein